MRKVILCCLIVAVVLSFGSLAFAGRGSSPVITCAPVWDSCAPDADSVFFDWNIDVWSCRLPSKYALDVELLISGEGFDDPEAEIQKLSFGTGGQDDPTETSLDVLLEGFVYWDGFAYVPFTGDARVKVKGLLTPGRSQNNTFSDWCNFSIEAIGAAN